MIKFLQTVILTQLAFLIVSASLSAQIKDTHKIIEEWIETKLIISEETAKWESEKAALTDLQDALSQEIEQLDKSLEMFQKEETTIEEERSKLTARREAAQKSTRNIFDELEKLRSEIDSIFKILPTPLGNKLITFREKLEDQDLPLSLIHI